ncbi:MAG: EamA family transporter [Actinobacteria bacterium]|nr:EamA family transporter [Actinomycetota bacterium]
MRGEMTSVGVPGIGRRFDGRGVRDHRVAVFRGKPGHPSQGVGSNFCGRLGPDHIGSRFLCDPPLRAVGPAGKPEWNGGGSLRCCRLGLARDLEMGHQQRYPSPWTIDLWFHHTGCSSGPAVLGGTVLLGERLTWREALGLGLIVAGGWRLSRSRSVETAGEYQEGPTEAIPRKVFRRGLVFPLLAALAYATQDVVTKGALVHLDDARFGALIGGATALCTWLAALAISGVRKQVRVGEDYGWLILSGFLAGLAIVNLFTALRVGDITVVSPIVATQPLAVFFLSRILLRRLELLHASIVLAGVGIVAGTALVSL